MIDFITTHWLEILGTLVGLVYLWLELKANKYMWIAGVIMPAISIFVYYDAGLYADLGINVYYLVAAVYGYVLWQLTFRKNKRKKDSKTKELPISRTPRKMYWILFATFALAFVAIGLILKLQTDSTVPWWDSFTTAMSIVGMWMLARKWIEQWWTWIIVDGVCFGLYIYKGIYFYAALYGFYTIVAVYGYYKWKRMMGAAPSRPPRGGGEERPNY